MSSELLCTCSLHLLNSQYLARSCPSSLSSRSLGPFSLVHTGAMTTETPWSLAPISAPHIQAGLLRTTAWVFLTWSTSMYVHFNKKKLYNHINLMNFGVQHITCKHHFALFPRLFRATIFSWPNQCTCRLSFYLTKTYRNKELVFPVTWNNHLIQEQPPPSNDILHVYTIIYIKFCSCIVIEPSTLF